MARNDWVPGVGMTFNQILEAFRVAVEGKDVKDKMYWTVKYMIDTFVEGGNANFEVKLSRGAFKDLASRLDASDDKLTSTAAQLAREIGELGSVATFKGSDTNANILAKTGMQVGDEWYDTTNQVSLRWNGFAWADVGAMMKLGDETVTGPKVAPGAIGADKTDFIITSSNLFDFDNSVIGQVIGQTGAVSNNSDYGIGNPIVTRAGEVLHTIGVGSIAYYNSSGEFISRSGNNSSFGILSWTVPVGAYIARPNFRTQGEYYLNRTIQVNRGSLEDFEPYYMKMTKLSIDTVNIDDDSLSSRKYKEDSITASKADFIKSSSNLFDKSNVTMDKVITVQGEIVDNISYLISHKIDTQALEKWYLRGVHSVAIYDSADNFIRRVEASNQDLLEVTMPNGAYYFVANIDEYQPYWTNGTVQINRGKLSPYEDYYQKLNKVGTEEGIVITKSSNLFDIDSVEMGKLIDASGNVVSNNDYFLGEPIEVEPGERIDVLGMIYIAYMQRNGEFIQRIATNSGAHTTLTIPQNVNLIKPMATYYNANVVNRTARINRGGLQDFEPFYKKIEVTKVEEVTNLHQFKQQDIYLKSISALDYYTAETVPAKSDMASYSVADQYANFNSLMTTYPDYITRKSYGKDTSGTYDVYEYTFSAPTVPKELDGKRPKVLVVAGNHGYEKTHPYILYHAMKQLCDNWKDHKFLEDLFWNVDIVVVPCSNPSSWANGSRGNSNNVDISRNFEYRWSNADAPSGFTKGSAPLSEKESQYIDKMIRDNKDDAVFFTSLHDFETVENNPEQFIWLAAADDFASHIGQELISGLSRKWKKKYSWLPQDDTYFGFVDKNQPFGGEGHQANLYGVQGGTFEVSDIFKLEPSATYDSEIVLTLGVETLINYMYLNAKHGVDYYNAYPKTGKKYSGKGL